MHPLLTVELTVDRQRFDDRFEVTISTYRLETSEEFTLEPGDAEALHGFEQRFNAGTPEHALEHVKHVGAVLFGLIFRGEVLAEWRAVRREATHHDYHIRLLLNFMTRDTRDLVHWPWELLYDHDRGRFLVLDEGVTLVRRLGGPIPQMRKFHRPVRILGVLAQPTDRPELENAEAEREALTRATNALGRQVQVTWIASPATPARLIDALRSDPYDILHYIGHAERTERGDGVLVLENENGTAVHVSASELAVRTGQPPLTLALLNACQTAAPNQHRAFESLAQTLMREAGIPTVIANRFAVSDKAAQLFAQAFYRALLDGAPVEIATAVARRHMAETKRPNWVSPVLLTYLTEPLDFGLRPPQTLLDRFISYSPAFFAAIVGLLTALITVTVVATWRQLGPAVAVTLQLSVWLVSAWFAYDSQEKIRERRNYVISALGVGALAALLFFAWSPTVEITEPSEEVTFEITEPPPAFRPEEAKAVRLTTPVEGRIAGMPANHTLWLLLRADGGARYTPLVRAEVRPDGTFEAREVVVGPVSHRQLDNRVYHIQPVLADPEADARFERWSRGLRVFFHPDVRVTPEPRLPDALIVRR